MFKTYTTLIFLLIPLIFSSCFVEQRIAYSFQKEMQQTSVLYRNSAEVFINNLKVEIPRGLSQAEKELLYDSAYFSSDLVQYIDFEDYKARFNEYFAKSLRKNNVKVYTADSITAFINQKTPRLIIEVVQIEIEELYNEYYDELSDYPLAINTDKYLHLIKAQHYKNDDGEFVSNLFTAEILRNEITINTWLKMDLWINDTSLISNTIYVRYSLEDNIEGVFTGKNTPDVNYIYTIDSITPTDLWKISEIPAQKFATYAIEYMINTVVEDRLIGKGNNSRNTWRISDKSGRILPTNEDLPYVIME